MPCTRPSVTEALRKPMYVAPSRSLFAVAVGSERATIATLSRLWQTSPSSLAKSHACPNVAPSPSFAGALAGWRQCCQMARIQRRVSPSQPFVANRTFFSSSRSVSRPPCDALRCCTLLGEACGGRYAEYARTLQTPFQSAPPEFYDCFFWAAPRDPGVYPRVGYGL
jgi:hypothetical protein